MALWCIKDDKDSHTSTTSSRVHSRSPDYEYDIVRPLAVKTCKKAEKVRALGYNHNNHVRTRNAVLKLCPLLEVVSKRTLYVDICHIKLVHGGECV